MERYVCNKCKSDNILIRAWINPKEDTIEVWDETECYCLDCQGKTEYEIIND